MSSSTDMTVPATDDGVLAAKIGVRARGFREASGWHVTEVADRAGIARDVVSAIEDGARLPSLAVLCRLASALQVAPGELLPAAWERPQSQLHLPITDDPDSSAAQIVGGGHGNTTQTYLFELRAGEGDGGFGEHPGEEVLIVTEGEVVVSELGRPDQTVRAGQSRVIATHTHHAVRGGDSGPARFLVICTDATVT